MSVPFTSSLLVIFLMQAVTGVSLFFIFRHFSRLHQRKYLVTWSWAWLYFAASMILLGLGGAAETPNFLMILRGFFALFLFCVFIILFHGGVMELIRSVEFHRRSFLPWIGVAFTISLTLILIGEADNSDVEFWGLTRAGVRHFIASISFVATGLILSFTRRLAGGLGHRIMSWSMILFGVEQGYFSVLAFLNAFHVTDTFPSFFGAVDLVLIFGIGFGTIIWLLEDEGKELRKTNNELDRFIYSTSHDLRSPIASVLGLVNLARLELKDEKSLELMGMMEQRMKKLDSVIRDFLDLARSKKSEANIKPVSLNLLIDEVVSDVKFAKDAPSIRLIYDRSADFMFHSDFSLMKTILANLFSNSVKYHDISKADPYIRVSYRKLDYKIQIDVEDNGQGIRVESLDKVFNMFYRASANSEGTGLGLYIVKEAVEKLNGTIFAKSFYGSGSTFTILLPDQAK